MGDGDLEAVRVLAARDQSVWTPEDYLSLDTLVAVAGHGGIAGFLASRTLIEEEEHEILNILVDPALRGRGIGSKLLKTSIAAKRGIWYLEVRAGNAAALRMYNTFGFSDFGRRKGYYKNPYEDAIVMRFRS